ncbi:MAG: flagellar basal body protein FliL, partial [Ignavibacteria bacterium]
MAEEKNEAQEKKEGGFNIKVVILGLPLFIVQLIAVYFITANLLMDKFAQNAA